MLVPITAQSPTWAADKTGEEKEMMNKKIGLMLLVTAALLSGCASRTAPIKNVSQTVAQSYSDEQMKQAIIQAGTTNKWTMTPVGPGAIDGYLAARGYSADIRVNYTANSYQILYVSSQNLKAGSGQIHRNYNVWIDRLDRSIQTRLKANAYK
ncbi:hypothetical protein [Pantoea sp. RIT-PI-b]